MSSGSTGGWPCGRIAEGSSSGEVGGATENSAFWEPSTTTVRQPGAAAFASFSPSVTSFLRPCSRNAGGNAGDLGAALGPALREAIDVGREVGARVGGAEEEGQGERCRGRRSAARRVIGEHARDLGPQGSGAAPCVRLARSSASVFALGGSEPAGALLALTIEPARVQ